MNNPIPTVTIAISAFNEEENIKTFLRSILSQKETNFILDQIIVVSDGSTDKTNERVRSIKSAKIKLITHDERAGKSVRLNQLYQRVSSDILIQSDSDVIFSHPYVTSEIIKPIIQNEIVGMCGGNPKPLRGTTFTEKAVNCTVDLYSLFRKTIKNGNNVFSADGRLLALKKELVKQITIPHDMIANDMFAYYTCLTKGYAYAFVESAVVFYRSPQTVKEHVRQNTRFLAGPLRMTKYFPKELIAKEHRIPPIVLLKGMMRQFLKHPILSSYIFVVNRYCKLKAFYLENKLSAQWSIAYTTKKLYKG